MTIPLARPGQNTVGCENCTLNPLCLPAALSADEIERLDHELERPKPLDHGESLFFCDANADAIFAVRSGSLKTVISTPEGEQQITGFYLPGEIVGMDGLANGHYACNAVALERTSVCSVPVRKLHSLASDIPNLSKELLQTAGKAIADDQRRILLLGQMVAAERLACFLLDLSNRLSDRGYSSESLHLSMSRHELANYLGLAVETVSRLFSRFRNEGILEVSNREVRILDRSALTTMVGECADESHCATG